MIAGRISTRAGEIFFSEAGTGRRGVVMLHGNSGSKESFASQVSGLPSDWRRIAFDLAGHGQSSDALTPSKDYTLGGHADYVAEAISKLDLETVVVVGFSLGGHIALELPARLPNLLGLMIISTPPFSKSEAGLQAAFPPGPGLLLATKEHLSPEDIDAFARIHAIGPTGDEQTLRRAIARSDGRARVIVGSSLLLQESEDQLHLAEECPVPLAVVVGEEDTVVDTGYIQSVRFSNLWRGKVHSIPGAGHAPQISHPASFNELLRQLLSDLRGPQATG